MRISTIWIVRDPGPASELGDVLWSTTPARLANYMRGCPVPETWTRENHEMFTERGEAVFTALVRFKQLQPARYEAAKLEAVRRGWIGAMAIVGGGER